MTPVLKEEDTIFPGEGWFFYWKTSPSLWEEKVKSYLSRYLICPIFWGHHVTSENKFDFGEAVPETDLKKLTDIASRFEKEVIFFLPLGPAPFLPNGGVPSSISRYFSSNGRGMTLSAVDSSGNINKMVSFFDHRIFHAYSNFITTLGNFFESNGIEANVFGVESYYYEENQTKDYMEDYSRVFEEAFARYLNEPTNREKVEELKKLEDDPEKIRALAKLNFSNSIKELYRGLAEDALGTFWEGKIEYVFLGGGTKDLVSRIFDIEDSEVYSKQLFKSLSIRLTPSSILLPFGLKSTLLRKQFLDIVENCLNFQNFGKKLFCEKGESFYLAHHSFELFYGLDEGRNWDKMSLLPYIRSIYPYTYKLKSLEDLIFSEDIDYNQKVIFVEGKGLTKKILNFILRIFMNGGNIVLNTKGLNDQCKKRLELFILENGIESEKINFKCSLEYMSLGDGKFIILNGNELEENSQNQLLFFWERVLNIFDCKHPKFKGADDLLFFWKYRETNSMDLNFEEIRRLSVYNPTSYKKKVKVCLEKSFSLIKLLDQGGVQVSTQPYQIEIKLSPGGFLSLDLGVYS